MSNRYVFFKMVSEESKDNYFKYFLFFEQGGALVKSNFDLDEDVMARNEWNRANILQLCRQSKDPSKEYELLDPKQDCLRVDKLDDVQEVVKFQRINEDNVYVGATYTEEHDKKIEELIDTKFKPYLAKLGI